MRKNILRMLPVLLAVLLLGSGTALWLNGRSPASGSGAAEETADASTGAAGEKAGEQTETEGNSDGSGVETSGEAAEAQDDGADLQTSGGDVQSDGTGQIEQGETEQALYVTVLGDSIAKGYSGDRETEIECYGSLAAQKISEEAGVPYSYQNFAKNGLDSAGMNEKILLREEVQESIASADVIFITIGSNDLLNECKRVVQEILNTDTKFKSADDALAVLEDAVKENPFLILKVINALSNWDYQSFEAQWINMMDTVCSLKQEDAKIIVTNIYNPVANLELPSTMNQVVEDIIGNMNSIIDDHAAGYGYCVADLFDSEISEHVQDDGLHPDQEGQQLISDIVYEEYKTLSQE